MPEGACVAETERFRRTDTKRTKLHSIFIGTLRLTLAQPSINKPIERNGKRELFHHHRIVTEFVLTNGIAIFENLATLLRESPREIIYKAFHRWCNPFCRNHFAIAQRTCEEIDPARPRAHLAQRPSELLFKESTMSLIEHRSDVRLQFAITNALRLLSHSIIISHFGQTHHITPIFEHSNPEIPIFSCNNRFTITTHTFEIFTTIERASVDVVASCQQSERKFRKLPKSLFVTDEFHRRTHHFHARLSF